MLCSQREIRKYSDVFLVDHAWTNDGGQLSEEQLKKMPQLVARMQNIFGLRMAEEPSDCTEYIDNLTVVCDMSSCSKEDAKTALAETKDCLIDAIVSLNFGSDTQPKTNSNEDRSPSYTFEEFKDAMVTCMPELSNAELPEEYVRKMYANFLEQGEKEAGAAMTSRYNWVDNQEDGFVYVYVAISPTVQKNDIKNTLTYKSWELEVLGEDLLVKGDLYNAVIPDESWWSIESPGVLCMALQKGGSNAVLWPVSLFTRKSNKAKNFRC